MKLHAYLAPVCKEIALPAPLPLCASVLSGISSYTGTLHLFDDYEGGME